MIEINNGEPGGKGKIFWQKGDAGKDGLDRYYKLNCTYNSGLGNFYNNFFWKQNTVVVDTTVVGKIYIRDFVADRFSIHIECRLKSKSVNKIEDAKGSK